MNTTCTKRIARARVVVLLCLIGGAAPLHARQLPDARSAYEEGIRSVLGGDTAAAIAQFDRALALDPSFADAHFRKGLLLSRYSIGKEGMLGDRLSAYDDFQAAIKWDPGNPLYMLELGKLLLRQEIRVDAQRLFQRALLEAERANSLTLAEVHYQLALMEEAQWMRFRYRHLLPIGIHQLRADMAFADPTYVWDLLNESRFLEDQGLAERDAMLRHLRAALESHPSHSGAASHLLAYYYDEGLMEDFMLEARRFTEAAPRDPKAYLGLGLGLQRLGRSQEAAGAYQFALQLMRPIDREDFLAVSRLMTKDDAEAFGALEDSGRREARRRFWMVSDPLFLTPTNEFWVEYQARMAYADLRFGIVEDAIPGWRTDRGAIWVRYGPPERWATFPPDPTYTGDMEAQGRITTVWSYGKEGPVFMFRQNPGYREATFANDFRFYADDYRSIQPVLMTSPTLPTVAHIPAQLARFRGPAGGVALEVHAALPLDSLRRANSVTRSTVDRGVFVIDESGREIRRDAEPEVIDFPDNGGVAVRSWRLDVPAGQPYVVSVEARDPIGWSTARHRVNVEAKAFPPGQPSMSDLLLATRIEPRVDVPMSRADLDLTAEPTLSFDVDDPVGMYVELYNLIPDSDQFASYELEIAVIIEEIYRQGPVRQLVGEIGDLLGITDEGERATQLRFGKEERVVARDMIPEYFNLELDDAPAGRYRVELRVVDRNAGVELFASRVFELGDTSN